MSMTLNVSIEEKISELEDKSTRIERSKDIESKVVTASNGIERVADRLQTVQELAEELAFYVRLYDEALADRGDQPASVGNQVQTARRMADISDEELLEAAQDERLAGLEDRVERAEKAIEDAIGTTKERIQRKQNEWESKLESARELAGIVGGDDSFRRLIVDMEGFLGSEMWNMGRQPSTLVAEWERYQRRWDENAGKHGWETFQQEHQLDDQTVAELKQFGDDKPVRLSDLSLKTLEEIKGVPELESALQLEVRS